MKSNKESLQSNCPLCDCAIVLSPAFDVHLCHCHLEVQSTPANSLLDTKFSDLPMENLEIVEGA